MRASLGMGARTAVVLVATLFGAVAAQEALSLPPPCPLNTFAPGDRAPAFTVALTSGANLTVPGPPDQLPLALFAVDFDRDPGGVLLATDVAEIDFMLAQPPPSRGLIAFLSAATEVRGVGAGPTRGSWHDNGCRAVRAAALCSMEFGQPAWRCSHQHAPLRGVRGLRLSSHRLLIWVLRDAPSRASYRCAAVVGPVCVCACVCGGGGPA